MSRTALGVPTQGSRAAELRSHWTANCLLAAITRASWAGPAGSWSVAKKMGGERDGGGRPPRRTTLRRPARTWA